MAVVNVEGVYALQGQNRHFPLGTQVGSYGAAKTYVNQFFTRGMAKDAIFAEVLIWSVGGKHYYRRFKDGQWSKWTSRYSKLPNPRDKRGPSKTGARLLANPGIFQEEYKGAFIYRFIKPSGYGFNYLGEPKTKSLGEARAIIDEDLRKQAAEHEAGKSDADRYWDTLSADERAKYRRDPRVWDYDSVKDFAYAVRPARNPRRLVANPYLHKFIPPGGKGYQYVYSEEDVAQRHAKKAQRIEALKRKEASLRAAVKRDVAAGNDAALAVGLILATYERPGNPGSAKAGHYGVTGWECRHLSTDKRKAVIDYIGKSGVHQTKTVKEPYLVEALAAKARQCGKRKGGKLLPVSASAVNRYLDTFDVSAKDLRTFGANTEMQRELKRARAAGPDLSTLKPRDVKKTLKAEFTAALGVVASRLGHTTSVLRKQYLVSTVEPTYLETGAVVQTFT